MKRVYETIFEKLEKLGIIRDGKLTFKEYIKLESCGFMDLHIDLLERTDEFIRISLAHNYEQNGDIVPDPDMELKIYPKLKMAEALTFQDTYGYREVYPEPDKVDIHTKKDLNAFLSKWLTNLLNQGFKKE